MANNCYNKTLKNDRVFETGCLAINSKGQILADNRYYHEKNFERKAIRVREAPWFEDDPYNDEQIIKVDLKLCEQHGVKYLYFYMLAPEVDTKPQALIEQIEKTHYHMFNKDTGVNFHRVSSVANLHQNL